MTLKGFLLVSLISIAFCDTLSFQPIGHPGEFMCHRDWNVIVAKVHSEPENKASTFKIVPGLADPSKGNAISFESVDHEGYFLHQRKDSLIHLGARYPQYGPPRTLEQQKQFEKEATFLVEAGNLTEGDTEVCSFRSFFTPDHFIRVRNHKLFVETGNDYLFHKDSTFRALAPNWVPHN